MARLIDADKLRNWISWYDHHECVEISVERVCRDIDNAPTVDAVEVVHGRWKYFHKQNIAVCTNCSFERDLDANFGKAVSCPNCGAKMDGERKDNGI